MPASLQKFSDDRMIDPSHEHPIQCPYCPQKYLLLWDDAEWNSVKDWIAWRRLPCVEVIGPFEKFNLSDRLRLQPHRLLHVLRAQFFPES